MLLSSTFDHTLFLYFLSPLTRIIFSSSSRRSDDDTNINRLAPDIIVLSARVTLDKTELD